MRPQYLEGAERPRFGFRSVAIAAACGRLPLRGSAESKGEVLPSSAESKEDPDWRLRHRRRVRIEPIDMERIAEAIALWHEVGHDGHRGWVYYLAVSPVVRHPGCGREMMQACEAWLRDRGVPKLNLMVRGDNHQALGFYRAIGYEPDDVRVLSRKRQPARLPVNSGDQSCLVAIPAVCVEAQELVIA